jgi:FkbM family methyltransferase
MNNLFADYTVRKTRNLLPPRMYFTYRKLMRIFGGHGLGRFYPVRAADHAINWMLRPRVAEIMGHKMFLDSSDSLHLSVSHTYEPLETGLVHQLVKAGDSVVDIGANIGYYTLLLAKLVGEQGRVFAFEPEPRNLKLLQKNVALSGYRNIVVIPKAASNTTGNARLYLSDYNNGDHRMSNSSEPRDSIAISTVRIDEELRSYDRPIRLIKMDVQGHEASALEGMPELLSRNRSISILSEFWPVGLKRSGADPWGYLACYVNRGFTLYHLNESANAIEPAEPANLMGPQSTSEDYYTNILATRDAGFDRCTIATN